MSGNVSAVQQKRHHWEGTETATELLNYFNELVAARREGRLFIQGDKKAKELEDEAREPTLHTDIDRYCKIAEAALGIERGLMNFNHIDEVIKKLHEALLEN